MSLHPYSAAAMAVRAQCDELDRALANQPSFSRTLTNQPSFNHALFNPPSVDRTLASRPSFYQTQVATKPDEPDFEVKFDPGDPDNPLVRVSRPGLISALRLLNKRRTGREAYVGSTLRSQVFSSSTRMSPIVFAPADVNSRDICHRTFSSSAPANILPSIQGDLGFNQEEGNLIVAIFVTGFCFGASPLTSVYTVSDPNRAPQDRCSGDRYPSA
jgi:hypothetical protein